MSNHTYTELMVKRWIRMVLAQDIGKMPFLSRMVLLIDMDNGFQWTQNPGRYPRQYLGNQ